MHSIWSAKRRRARDVPAFRKPVCGKNNHKKKSDWQREKQLNDAVHRLQEELARDGGYDAVRGPLELFSSSVVEKQVKTARSYIQEIRWLSF